MNYKYENCKTCAHRPFNQEASYRCTVCNGYSYYHPDKVLLGTNLIPSNSNPTIDAAMERYAQAEINMTKEMVKQMLNNAYGAAGQYSTRFRNLVIKNVIFNPPATIVFWADNTKTVVKCGESDVYDPEKGLTMAITKKLYGNKGSYYNEIKKWTEPYYEKIKEEGITMSSETQPSISSFEVGFDFIPVTEHFGYIPYLYAHGTEYKIFRVDYMSKTFDSMDISYKREFYAIERCKKLEEN